ncbi:Ricin-type beta-trefoil lectin domain protein [Aphelenchoides fujianensis]|nr:Ricin-type beta-trefoil lectin domain protein [Aphelenchoides fujianensis]
MRVRTDICRAILLTSLVWAVLDVVVIFYYLDSGSTVDRQAYVRNPKFAEFQPKNATIPPAVQPAPVFFFAMVPGARDVDPGDITDRQKLRTELQCKNFKCVGQMMNDGSKTCLDTMGKKTGQSPGLSACHGMGGNQVWSLTTSGEIRSDELCLSVRGMPLKYTLRMEKCLLSKISQWHRFEYDEETKQVRSTKHDLCIVVENGGLDLASCATLTPASQWTFEKNTES